MFVLHRKIFENKAQNTIKIKNVKEQQHEKKYDHHVKHKNQNSYNSKINYCKICIKMQCQFSNKTNAGQKSAFD